MTQEPTASRNDGRPPSGFGRVRKRSVHRPRDLSCDGDGGNGEPAALIGESRTMRRLRAEVSGLARCDDTVILTGETGVGKDLVALQLHRESPRRTRAFVTLCCPWLDEERVAALTCDPGGAPRGSGPPDATGRPGPMGDGTLFLDRVDEADLLALQRIARLVDAASGAGGAGDRSWRTRARAPAGSIYLRGAPRPRLIVSVGNGSVDGKCLIQLLAALFGAGRMTQLEIPPLRSRREDVPLLLEHFRRHFDRREGRRSRFSQRFLDHALEHSWPGNVRELRNVVENAHILADGGLLDAWSVSGP